MVYGRGGGLYNEGRIGDITSIFINNYVNAPDGAGGALYNSNLLGDINGNFIGNYIISPWVEDGALYGKHSSLSGGALYAGGQINTINANYTNGAGVKINSDPLHAIQIAPNVRLIMNTKNGWQPYATFGMHWNIMDNTNVTANRRHFQNLVLNPISAMV